MALVLLVGASLGAQQAAPVWESVPYGEWTLEQTLQVLADSPWARPAALVEPGVEQLGRGPQHYAQWYSAQTVREALVRLRNLSGAVNPEADARFLSTPPTAYQVFVFVAMYTERGEFRSLPLPTFEGMTEEALQQSVLLHFTPLEVKSRPDKVEFVRNQRTQQVVGLRLLFERAREAVPPALARSGQVRLICPTARGSLSATFQLGEMQRRAQPDL